MIRFDLDLAPMGKQRPRVTSFGTYMPHGYRAWKAEVAGQARAQVRHRSIAGEFVMALDIRTPSGKSRSDVDNIAAGILDALQDGGVIGNDRDCRGLLVAMSKAEKPGRGQKAAPSMGVALFPLEGKTNPLLVLLCGLMDGGKAA